MLHNSQSEDINPANIIVQLNCSPEQQQAYHSPQETNSSINSLQFCFINGNFKCFSNSSNTNLGMDCLNMNADYQRPDRAQDVVTAQDDIVYDTKQNTPPTDIGTTNSEYLADLYAIKSGDLMKFSQESVINEMIAKGDPLSVPECKQNLNVLPSLEENDTAGYKFQLIPPTKNIGKGKSTWDYSEKLNEVYIRMNEVFSIEVAYSPKKPQIPLRVRMLLCFVKEVSEPVLRCQNHISKDNEPNAKRRLSLLRCENPDAEYIGSDTGRHIMDRYSIIVPLNMSVQPGVDNCVKQTIAMKFSCQNSCIGRKETCIIFLLESLNGEILAQRNLNVKICTCPKRDRFLKEQQGSLKRKKDDDVYSIEQKLNKCTTSPSLSPTIPMKMEGSSSDSDDNSNHSNIKRSCYDIKRLGNGRYRLKLDLDNTDMALRVIELVCGATALNKNANTKNTMKRLEHLYEKVQML